MTFFTAEDFMVDGYGALTPFGIAQVCNQKLQREGMVVYGDDNDGNGWAMFGIEKPKPGHTHRAFLICVEEMPKKECEHVPRGYSINVGGYARDKYYRCEKCGVKLKATWEVVDEQR